MNAASVESAVPETAYRGVGTNWSAFERALACLALVMIGLRVSVHAGVTTGYLLAVLMAPLWIRSVTKYRGITTLMIAGTACVVAGYALSAFSASTNVVESSFRDSSIALLVGTLASIGVVIWARERLSIVTIGVSYGIGMLVSPVLNSTPAGGNAWKFLYAMPLAITCLALARLAKRPRRVELGILAGLALLSAMFDSRSYFGTFVLAGMLVLWQMRPRTRTRGSAVATVVLLAVTGAATYYVLSTLLVSGYLGAAAQARSIAQIQASGSLIVGGRPELQATLALFQYRPVGFGFGVIANPTQVLVAKTGLNSIHYAPNNGYVERFMFGNQIELHSVIGDLWAQAGLLGIAFTLLVAFIVVRGTAGLIAESAATALVLYLSFWNLWNLFFSPFFSAAPTLVLGIGLAAFPIKDIADRKPALARSVSDGASRV